MRYLIKVKGYWYFNMRIPKDLLDILRVKVVRKALHTTSLKDAKVLVKSHSFRLERIFVTARLGIMSNEEIRKMLSQYLVDSLNDSENYRTFNGRINYEDDIEGASYYWTDLLEDCEAALITNKLKYAEPTVDRLLEDKGIVHINKDSDEYRTLCREMLKVLMVLGKTELRRMSGNYEDKPLREYLSANSVNQIVPIPTKKILLSELVSEFIEYKKTVKERWTTKTKGEMESIFRRMIDILGDIDVLSINGDTSQKYAVILSKLPSNMKKREYKGKTIDEIVKMVKSDEPTLSAKTRKKSLESVSSLMEWAVEKDYLRKNYFKKLAPEDRRKSDEMRKPYDIEDLKRLLASPIYTSQIPVNEPETFFIPLVALYTGMRINEICQLYCEDIKSSDGVDYIDNVETKDKRVKTEAGERRIPIHPVLKRVGFLDYVREQRAKGKERLWNNLSKDSLGFYSASYGKKYGRYNRKYITQDKLKTFHSFRHTFANELKQQGVNIKVREELMGHEDTSMSSGLYAEVYNLPVLEQAIMKLKYKGLSFDGIKWPTDKQ